MESQFLVWLLARGPREREVKDAADKLQVSIRTTTKCRFNASVRLQQQSSWAFFATTVLSLGLVFIPLMQAAQVNLKFASGVLNVVQIFLAVSVLVYSIVIGAAKYELRAEQLTECGNRLKELIREMELVRESSGGVIAAGELGRFQKTYSDVVTDVENHDRNDYRFALLEMRSDYYLSGLPRLQLFIEAHTFRLIPFLVPTLLIAIEITFISDMLGMTNVFRPYLDSKVAS